ncbi:MAG: DUF4388 domain-containing protein [Myxococcota bacterium]
MNELSSSTDDLEQLSEAEERLEVELQQDGRLRAPSSEARRLLRARLGRAELLPTGPGWTVLRDLDGAHGEGPTGREVVCCGTLHENGVSLIDFIGFLATGYQTGVVTVAVGPVERSVYFHQGDVVWASSTSAQDRLGEFLLRRGKITRDQLQTAMRRGDTRIGRACVECGFIAAHDLWAVVQAQLKEIFDQMIRAEDGLWTFARTSSEALAESRIHLSTQGLLVDALRRLDEMKVFRERIRSAEEVIQRGAADLDVLDGHKEISLEQANGLLRHLGRPASINELMRRMGKSEFDVTHLVHHLLNKGLVEIMATQVTGPVPRRQGVALERAAEVLEVYDMALREMVEELGSNSGGVVRSARAFIEDPHQQHAQILRGVRLRDEGTLDQKAMLAWADQAGVSVNALNDALSELLFFVLFQATDLLGHKRGDDLARRVKIILALLNKNQEA